MLFCVLLVPSTSPHVSGYNTSLLTIVFENTGHKEEKKLCSENDLRVALDKAKPLISHMVSQRQQQKSH